jgi:branched-chain amino acid transport system substrate-binding protein
MSRLCARSSGMRLGAALAAAMLTAGLAACSSGGSAGSSGSGGSTIKIGLVFPTTGSMAPLGIAEQNAAKLVLDWANSHGGINGTKIQYFEGDSQSNPATGATVAQQLISTDGVQIIIGSYASAIAQAIAPVAERNKVILWEEGAVSPTVAQGSDPYFFRTVGPSGTYAAADLSFLQNYLAAKLGKPLGQIRVAIAHEDGPFGTSVADAITAQAKPLGVNIVADIAYPETSADLTPVVLQLKAAKPDVLLYTPLVASAPVFWQDAQAQNLGLKAIIGSAGIGSSAFLKKFGAKGVQGVYDVEAPAIATMNSKNLRAQVRADLTALLSQYKSQAGAPCLVQCGDALGGTYDLVKYVLPAAVASGSVTPDSIRAAALKVNVPAGGTPQGFGLKFSATSGDNTAAQSVIMQWQNGSLVVVYPTALAAAAPLYPMPSWSQR